MSLTCPALPCPEKVACPICHPFATPIEAACWSPDGKQIAVQRFDWQRDEKGEKFRGGGADHDDRFEIIDADGTNSRELRLDDVRPIWMGHPEWR